MIDLILQGLIIWWLMFIVLGIVSSFSISQSKVGYDTPSSVVYERKFDTAIRNSFANGLIYRWNTNTSSFDDKLILMNHHIDGTPLSWNQTTTHLPSLMINLLKEHHHAWPLTKVIQRVNKLQTITQDSVRIQLQYILLQNISPMKSVINNKLKTYLNDHELPRIFFKLIDMIYWLTTIVEDSQRVKNRPRDRRMSELDKLNAMIKTNTALHEPTGLRLVWSIHLLYISFDNISYIAPKSVLLMLHNKLCDLLSVMLLSWYSQGTVYSSSSFDLCIAFIKEICKLHNLYGSNYFTIAKNLEALCIGETLIEHEEWSNPEFLKCITDDMYEKTKFDYLSSYLRQLYKEADTPFRHELSCLSKLTGHPYVDMLKGSKDLYHKANEVYKINLLTVGKCIAYCKENYIRNHIYKHGKWPPSHLVNGRAPKALEQAFILNKDPNDLYIRKKFGKVRIEDYVHVELEQSMTFREFNNVIPLLKDKTISVLRSKVMTSYLSATSAHSSAKLSWKDTRLLLAYMLHPTLVHNHQQYMADYTNSLDFESLLDYLVIRVVPKEKELKESFRGFGCKTMEDRMRALSQEKEAMRFLEEYSDEQAMTLGELDLLRRLDAFRRLKAAYTNHKILYIVIDATAWNNHFRKETVDTVMSKVLDKVYHTSIFGKTHQAYESTLVYVPDIDKIYFWKGQCGGIEGLNQDTWVIAYLGQIKTALEGLEYKYHILCKGDDLRIGFAIPNHIIEGQQVRDLKNDIVRRLDCTMKDFGHKIKIEESYGSSRYFAFSKTASLDTIELPQAFRKIQKCYGATNAFLPTLDEYIASTFSNAHSACKTFPTVIAPYMVALSWMYIYLLEAHGYKDMTNAQLTALSLIPSLLGGFPIIFLHNMHVRAESDLLSPFIGLYSFCKKHHPVISDVMKSFLWVSENHPTSYVGLYKDPYSLPIDRPQLPSAYLRSQIIPCLNKMVKNEDVKELLNLISHNELTPIVKVLDTANILHAKILSNLYSATPDGICDELTTKFETARSVNEIIVLRSGPRKAEYVLRQVVRKERNLQRWRCDRIKNPTLIYGKNIEPLIQDECPAKAAYDIRCYAWGKKVEGITMPPLQHQVYIVPACSTDKWCIENHFTYYLEDHVVKMARTKSEHYSVGTKVPFIGYSTRTGTLEPTIQFIEKDPILTKLKNLIDLASWTSTTEVDDDGNLVVSNCREIIECILNLYTSTPLSELSPFISLRKSGTVQHHIRSPSFRESIVPNILGNIFTRVTGESDSHIRLRTSKNHYKINFLHVMCYTIWNIMMELEFSSYITTPSITWSVTSSCSFCNTPIEEPVLIFDIRKLKNIKYNPLALTKVNQAAEKILQASIEKFRNQELRKPTTLDEHNLADAEKAVLQELMYNTYYSKRNLQNRHTQHSMSQEGVHVLAQLTPHSIHKDIGLTEIKCLSTSSICVFLIEIIQSQFLLRKYPSNITSLSSLINKIKASELPWYGLCTFLHKTGILPNVINSIANMSKLQPPVCHYNPSAASIYLAYAVFAMSQRTIVPPTFVYLSYYQATHLYHHITTLVINSIWCAFHKAFKPYLIKPSIMSDDIINSLISLFKQSYILLIMLESIESIVTDIVDRLMTKHEIKLQILDPDDVPYILYEETFHNCDSTACVILDTLVIKCGLEKEHVFMSDDDEYEDEQLHLTRFCKTTTTELHYYTLSDCIALLRSEGKRTQFDIDDVSSLDTDIIPRELDMENQLLNPNIHESRYARTFKSTEYIHPTVIKPHSEFIWTHSDVNQSFDRVYRGLGPANGSMSHLFEMLVILGIDCHRYEGLNIASIADGIGELSLGTVIAFGDFNQLLFHTLNEDVSFGKRPVFIDQRFPHLSSRILTRHLDEGFDRLDSMSTWDRMTEYNLVYHIVLVDLEIIDKDKDKLDNIYNLLGQFLCNNMHASGFAIIKINLSYIDYIQSFIMHMLSMSDNLIFYQPLSYRSTQWCYVIVSGIHRLNGDYKFLERYLWSDVVGVQIRQFLNTMLTLAYTKRTQSEDHEIDLHDISMHKYAKMSKYPIPLVYFSYRLRYLGIMSSNLSQDFALVELTEEGGNNWKDYVHKHQQQYLDRIRSLLSSLRTTGGLKHKSHDEQVLTRAQRMDIINNVSMCVGALSVLMLYKGPKEQFKVTNKYLNDQYGQFMSTLLYRDQCGWPNNNHKNLLVKDKGVPCLYYMHFRKGVNLILLWWSALTASAEILK